MSVYRTIGPLVKFDGICLDFQFLLCNRTVIRVHECDIQTTLSCVLTKFYVHAVYFSEMLPIRSC